jgi:hypothetical protein
MPQPTKNRDGLVLVLENRDEGVMELRSNEVVEWRHMHKDRFLIAAILWSNSVAACT